MQWHQTRGCCCYTAILPNWNGWRSGSKAGRCGTCRPTFCLPFLRARQVPRRHKGQNTHSNRYHFPSGDARCTSPFRPCQPTSVQKHTQSMGEQIVGTWRLESIYEEDNRGEEISQFGVAPTGLFMADRHGNFSFQIMSIDGRRYAAKGLSSTSMGTAGIVEAMHYFGTYAVHEQNHKL